MKEANIYYILRVSADVLEIQTLLARYLLSSSHRQCLTFAVS